MVKPRCGLPAIPQTNARRRYRLDTPDDIATIRSMKRIVRRVQSINERAAELTAAAGQLPNRVVELREAMTATSGQLQNLKNDIQVNVGDLTVEHEDGIASTLAEIAAHAPVFAEAGFLLDGVDIGVSPVQNLIVRLQRFKEVDTLTIQPLIQKHQQQPSVRAILSAIIQARGMVSSVDIDGMDNHQLIVGIGPVPSIRLSWRMPVAVIDDDSEPWSPAPSQSLTGAGSSFFGPPLDAPAAAKPTAAAKPAAATIEPATAAAEPANPEPTAANAPETPEAVEAVEGSSQAGEPAGTGSRPATTPPPLPEAPTPASPPPLPAAAPDDPLARFKVMPTLSRH
jgi:hypothetical protein